MPRFDEFDDASILTIGHLGIVAGSYDSLGIKDVIDRAIPKLRPHNLTHGDVIKAMVLNGLGFVERRLYLFPEFFDDIAIERLLGSGITKDQLNDDVLGRTLDAIAKYGPTELFNETCLKRMFQALFDENGIVIFNSNRLRMSHSHTVWFPLRSC